MASEAGLGTVEAASSLSWHDQKTLGLRESKLNSHKDPQTATNGRGSNRRCPEWPATPARPSAEPRRQAPSPRTTDVVATDPTPVVLAGWHDRLSFTRRRLCVCARCVVSAWPVFYTLPAARCLFSRSLPHMFPVGPLWPSLCRLHPRSLLRRGVLFCWPGS